jgi:hypothetical protein
VVGSFVGWLSIVGNSVIIEFTVAAISLVSSVGTIDEDKSQARSTRITRIIEMVFFIVFPL